MDKEEEPCQIKTLPLEPKTQIEKVSDSVSSFDSDSSLSEEETIVTDRDIKINTFSPLCNQYNDKIKIDSSDLVSDEEIIDYIYQNVLRVIIVSLELQSNVVDSAVWGVDGCKTPPSKHTDTDMVPDTCPGAPMKLTKISRNIDSGLRRKLF
ncbi:unnamed protein product [Cochlearia groenlandica]